MSDGPSAPTGTPVNPFQEALQAVLGIGELAFDRAGAFSRFVFTQGAFWRIYILGQVVIPAAIAAHVAKMVDGPSWQMMIATILSASASTAMACLMVVRLTAHWYGRQFTRPFRLEDVGPRTLTFLIPTLWGDMLQLVLLLLLGSIGNGGAQILQAAVLVTVLMSSWRAARLGLGLSTWQSVGMVAAFFLTQALVGLSISATLVMIHEYL